MKRKLLQIFKIATLAFFVQGAAFSISAAYGINAEDYNFSQNFKNNSDPLVQLHETNYPETASDREPVDGSTIQLNTVTGRVTSEENPQGFPGVNVVIKGTTQGTVTDNNGNYSIEVPSQEAVLVFSSVGFVTREIAVGSRSVINIQMNPDVMALEELVVIGYGVQRKEDLTGSVGTVEMSNLEGINLASPDEALMGQVAGVSVTQATGLPGSAPKFQLRGVSAVGAGAQPLFVVDGFALPQPVDQAEARLRNPLTNIPPQDIESITVLKDASATAIYGSRASNGVVVITTKSGRASNKPVVDVSVSRGVSNTLDFMLPEMANAQEFAEFQKFRWEDRVRTGQATEVPEVYRNPEQWGEGTNWFDVITQPGQNFRGDVSVSGGSENLRSYFSMGYTEQEGTTPGVDFSRMSLRANIDANLTNKLKAGLRLAPSYSTRHQPDSEAEGRHNAFGHPLMMSPILPAYDENGEVIPYPSEVAPNPGVLNVPNPLFVANNLEDERTNFRILSSMDLSYEIVDGLEARTAFNVDFGRDRRKFFHPSTVGGLGFNRPPPTIPTGSESEGTRINWLSETTINYQKDKIGPGRLNALAGFTVQQQAVDRTLSFSGTFPDDNVRTLNVASNITGSSNEESWSLVSGLGRINYSFLDDRYILTGTVRADGSSRFGEDNRWGVFPSAAFAWNISNEPFFANRGNTISDLKARLSFGQTGNNQIGNFSAVGIVDRADYLFGNSVAGGRALTTFANRVLGWEKTQEWNFGIDALLLNARLGLTLDLYNRETKDMLLNRELTTASGFATVVQNSGSMRNRGLEVSLNAVPIASDNLTWTADLNFALNRNKVTSLPGGESITAGDVGGGRPTHITKVGEPIGQFYGFIVEGIFQNQEEIDNSPIFGGEVPGNQKFRDVNEDGKITPAGDFAIIGSPHPDYILGFSTALEIGRFEARANLTGSVGGQIARQEYYRTAMNIDGVFNVAREYAVNFWRSEDEPGNGRMPTPLGGAQARGFFRTSHSDVVVSSTNVWLRSAMLRYDLTDILGVRSAGVYLSGQNLFVLTSYRGNPDADRNEGDGGAYGALVAGGDFMAYPVARTISIGIDLGF